MLLPRLEGAYDRHHEAAPLEGEAGGAHVEQQRARRLEPREALRGGAAAAAAAAVVVAAAGGGGGVGGDDGGGGGVGELS